ncbi:MAG: VWA domain-containing protein, partial [Planctomycetes bacterium]|nr:VWA domain-containing protein [Planctomycetota bacterium]
RPCSTDEDCANGETCVDGSCVSSDGSAGKLALENPSVDFSGLLVGQAYQLVAPTAAETSVESDSEEEATEGSDTDGEAGSQSGTLGEIVEDGETAPASQSVPADCTCVWSVTPTTAVEFAAISECTTTMTPVESGESTVGVAVSCGGSAAVFSQEAIATVPPTPCTENDDCANDELCLEGICAARTGPVITVLCEEPRAPFVVRFDLRLEDAAGDPIHQGVTREQFRIYEDDREIDYVETGYSVTAAPNLPLKVVLALDYTVSMNEADAIPAMITAAQEFVEADHFTGTHYLGLVEFHGREDQGSGFNAVAPLTRADDQGRALLAQAIPREGDLEPGLSRVWDAVALALSLLGEAEREPGEKHAIVFLTDGRDTTSETTADAVLAEAQADDVTLYPIGFGEVTENEALLQSLAGSTGGTYFSAENADALSDVFAGISSDLRGQWTLSYVTQRNSGTVGVRVEFYDHGASDSFETDVNVGGLAGDSHAAVVEVLDRQYDETADSTSFLIKAAYVPRSITRFGFFVASSASTFTLQEAGGLTSPDDGWILVSSDGRYDLFGPEQLGFGTFGNIGVVTVPGDASHLQIIHDDRVYGYLPRSKTVVFEGAAYLKPANLTVAISPPAGGAVAITPYKLAYALGASVTLSASAFGDYVFNVWSGGSTDSDFNTTVTMNGDQTVVANFYPPRGLTVVVSPTGAGTVSLNPSKTSYRHGEVVTLTATPIGSTFSAWSGGVTGTSTTATVTMDSDKTVTATFTVSE